MMQMKTLFLILAAFVIVTNQSQKYVQGRVTITVYYDSACGAECSSFLLFDQLFPTYSDLKPDMTVELVPYGTTTQTTRDDGSISFSCGYHMHCLQNKIHACAIKKFGPWQGTMMGLCFLMCTLRDPLKASKCAVRHGANHLAMATCVNSVEGDWLLADHAEKTKQVRNPVLKSDLPIITVDGIYNETEQAMARTNLLHLMCSHLKLRKNYPNVCHEMRAKVTMSHNNYDTNYVYPNNQMGCLRENEV